MISGNGESFIFTIKNENHIIKLKCIDKNKEIWNHKNYMPSFGSMALRLNNNSNAKESFAEIGCLSY